MSRSFVAGGVSSTRARLVLVLGIAATVACRKEAPPPPAGEPPAPAVSARARGNEPFWAVDVTPSAITYRTPDNIPDGLAFPAVAPVSDSMSHAWSTTAAGHSLSLRITREPCQDTMSGEEFAWKGTVQVDSMTASGCASVAGEEGPVREPASRP